MKQKAREKQKVTLKSKQECPFYEEKEAFFLKAKKTEREKSK